MPWMRCGQSAPIASFWWRVRSHSLYCHQSLCLTLSEEAENLRMGLLLMQAPDRLELGQLGDSASCT